jgi:hypothetical protein
MNSFRYRVTVAALPWAQELAAQFLADQIGNCSVQIKPTSDGRLVASVSMDRESHAQAMAEIEAAVSNLGWQIAMAVVEEWLDKLGQSLFLAAAGGAGGSRFGGEAGAAGLFGGFLAGLLAPPLVQIAVYEAHRVSQGWAFRLVGERMPRLARVNA